MALLCTSAAGWAAGGSSIANAPELPIAIQVAGAGGEGTNGGSPTTASIASVNRYYGEFWRVPLARADSLRIDYGSTNGKLVDLCLLASTVTDYTVSTARCKTLDATSARHEVRFIAPTAGRWTLYVLGQACCAPPYCCGSFGLAYELTAYVKHFTRASIHAPSLAKKGIKITLTGRVLGVTSGTVAIRATTRDGMVRSKVVSMTPDGRFSWSFTPTKAGIYRVRVSYYGDSTHRPSAASTVVHVA